MQKLCQLHNGSFDFVRFEEVIGAKFYSDTDEADLFHTSTRGITLDMLNELETPKTILREIMETHAEAMAELHRKGIAYTDPIPTNFKYDLRGKMICNPHNCTGFLSIEECPMEVYQVAEELGALLYSHAYLPSWKRFVQKYVDAQRKNGEKWDKKKCEDFLARVESNIAWAEEGGFELLVPELQKRNRVIVRKNVKKPYGLSISVARR